jgi:hypothetical protein
VTEKSEDLARLEKQLEDMKRRLPEHCGSGGSDEYVGVHHASPELLAEIEELEEKIKEIKRAAGP